ncbi:MAG: hypothetical protein ABI910_07420 [Gemmatimonadota bacterium]
MRATQVGHLTDDISNEGLNCAARLGATRHRQRQRTAKALKDEPIAFALHLHITAEGDQRRSRRVNPSLDAPARPPTHGSSKAMADFLKQRRAVSVGK